MIPHQCSLPCTNSCRAGCRHVQRVRQGRARRGGAGPPLGNAPICYIYTPHQQEVNKSRVTQGDKMADGYHRDCTNGVGDDKTVHVCDVPGAGCHAGVTVGVDAQQSWWQSRFRRLSRDGVPAQAITEIRRQVCDGEPQSDVLPGRLPCPPMLALLQATGSLWRHVAGVSGRVTAPPPLQSRLGLPRRCRVCWRRPDEGQGHVTTVLPAGAADQHHCVRYTAG